MRDGVGDGEQAVYVIRPTDGEDGAGLIAGITRLECEWERRSAMFELWLRKRFWGRGYSSERAAVLMELAFEQLDLDLIHVNHEDGNERSKTAIRKYIDAHGGQYDGLLKNWGRETGRSSMRTAIPLLRSNTGRQLHD